TKDLKRQAELIWSEFTAKAIVFFAVIYLLHISVIKASNQESNNLGIMLLGYIIVMGIIVPSLFWTGIYKNSLLDRLFGWLTLLCIYINLYLSASRMALALALLIPFCIALWKFRKHWLRCLLITGILIGAIGGAAFLRRSEHFSLDKIKLDLKVRRFIWQGAEEIFLEHPMLGCGYGTKSFHRNWPFEPPYSPELQDFQHIFSHAHNLWWHLLATQGVVGFLAFNALWVAVVYYLTKPVRRNLPPTEAGTQPAYATVFNTPVLFISLLGMLILQFNGILTLPLQGCNEILYWLVAGLGLAGLKLSADNK
ncbi:MAG: O-antigen ligase family protein, partial [Planctomycetes bacterium]|nr:O-antigen ligase family protein [Planctomycetota bacterium]